MTLATSATVRNLTSEMSPAPLDGPEFDAMMHRSFVCTFAPRLPRRRPFVCASVRIEPSVTRGIEVALVQIFTFVRSCRVDIGLGSRLVVQSVEREEGLPRGVDAAVQPHSR